MTSIRKLSALAALLVAAAPAIAGAQKPAPKANTAAAGTNAGSNAAGKSAAAATTADESIAKAAAEEDGDEDDRRIHLSGYVQPQFGVRYRPGAVPRDRTDYSAGDTRAGLIVDGNPVDKFHYALELVVNTDLIEEETRNTGVLLERAAVDWDPTGNLGVSVGQMRIPFSVENQISNTSLMFPNRAAANQVFLSGSDLGALGRLSARDGKMRVSGTDATSTVETGARGPLYTVRADIDPMGEMENGGRDTVRGPLKFGFGAGMIYYPSTTFDSAGFEGPKMRDLRASVSARAAVRGVYLQGEVLRRQRTDSLSSRPLVATGAYGQASYYVPLDGTMAISPMARLGWAVEDQSFDPRERVWTEAGMSLHLRTNKGDPDDLRLTLQYLGEHRVTERESAHGAVAQMQLRW
jgi:hypothetical protein